MTVTLNGQITADEIAASLPDSKRNGDGWIVRCPCHTDDKPSLSICDTDKGVLVHCFAGCDWKDVKKALGIYRNGNGWDKNAFLVAVYQHPDGRPRPRYREDHDGECWRNDCTKIGKHKHIWGEKGRSSTGCYLLTWGDDSPEKTLVLVEGEKAAKALLDHVGGKDYTPVTWNGGAGVSKAIFDVVDGRDVILWPDNDGPGTKAMRNAAVSARDAGAASLRMVEVKDLPNKADAADVNSDTALTLIEGAIEYEAPAVVEATSQHSNGIVWAVLSERGGPLRSDIANAVIALSEFEDLNFAYDEFELQELINGEAADDTKILGLGYRLSMQLHYSPTKDALFDAVTLLCRRNPFHPIRDYLSNLEWDRTLRLGKLATDYLCADGDPVAVAAAKMIPYGMVARALSPGCQYDYAVTLQGPQGCGKTSTLRILATDKWHSDSIPLTTFDPSKIVIERSRGKWIVELAELAGFRYSDQEMVKSMVSGRADNSRMAWGRKSIDVPRQFIFAGSTNSETFLRDTTGARRFPVVPCGKVNLKALERDRDQLLAEAVHDVTKMLPGAITIPPALFDEQAQQAEERRTVGGFEEWLHGYLEKHMPGTPIISDALRERMKEDLGGTPIYPNNTEFSQVMEVAGYRQVRKGKNRIRQWVEK